MLLTPLVQSPNALNRLLNWLQYILKPFEKTALQGASAALFVATATEGKINSKKYEGAYLEPGGKKEL
jgi:hypothetical protein